jgi:hypothetical protein
MGRGSWPAGNKWVPEGAEGAPRRASPRALILLLLCHRPLDNSSISIVRMVGVPAHRPHGTSLLLSEPRSDRPRATVYCAEGTLPLTFYADVLRPSSMRPLSHRTIHRSDHSRNETEVSRIRAVVGRARAGTNRGSAGAVDRRSKAANPRTPEQILRRCGRALTARSSHEPPGCKKVVATRWVTMSSPTRPGACRTAANQKGHNMCHLADVPHLTTF